MPGDPARVLVGPVEAGPDELRVVVRQGASIRGRVRFPDGTPVPGAVVHAQPEGTADAVVAGAVAGRDGAFEIQGLGAGPHEPTCGVRGAVRWNRRGVRPGADDVRVELDEGLCVAGFVLSDDHEALRFVDLTIDSAPASGVPSVRRTEPGVDGKFCVAALTPGRRRIRLARDEEGPPLAAVDAGAPPGVLVAPR